MAGSVGGAAADAVNSHSQPASQPVSPVSQLVNGGMAAGAPWRASLLLLLLLRARGMADQRGALSTSYLVGHGAAMMERVGGGRSIAGLRHVGGLQRDADG